MNYLDCNHGLLLSNAAWAHLGVSYPHGVLSHTVGLEQPDGGVHKFRGNEGCNVTPALLMWNFVLCIPYLKYIGLRNNTIRHAGAWWSKSGDHIPMIGCNTLLKVINHNICMQHLISRTTPKILHNDFIRSSLKKITFDIQSNREDFCEFMADWLSQDKAISAGSRRPNSNESINQTPSCHRFMRAKNHLFRNLNAQNLPGSSSQSHCWCVNPA